MLYWDDLYRVKIDELRHNYVYISDKLEVEHKKNDDLIKEVTDLKDKVKQYEDEIKALKHMLDRKDEEE